MTWHDLPCFLILAQQQQAQQDPSAMPRLMFMLTAMLLVGYFLFIRPQKKKEDEFRNMVDGLKEKDRVVTIGGIHGVVTNVRRDVEQVVIRVDESTGTKVHVGFSAIARVVADSESDNSHKPDGKEKKS